jgi:hypothetical protein
MRLANATICHTTRLMTLCFYRIALLFTSDWKQGEGRRDERKEERKKTGDSDQQVFAYVWTAHSHRSSRIHPDILQQQLASVAIAAVPLDNYRRTVAAKVGLSTIRQCPYHIKPKSVQTAIKQNSLWSRQFILFRKTIRREQCLLYNLDSDFINRLVKQRKPKWLWKLTIFSFDMFSR